MIPSGINYDTRPSIEGGLGQWSGVDASVSWEYTEVWVGTSALHIVPSTAGTTAKTIKQIAYAVPVVVADEVNISCMAKAAQGNGKARGACLFYTDSSCTSQVGSTLYGDWVDLLTTRFVNVPAVGFVVPATATYLRTQWEFDTTGGTLTTDDFYADGWVIRRNEPLDSYFDGSMGAGYAWLGTAHDSISTRAAGAGEVWRSEYDAPQIVVDWAIWRCTVSGQKMEDLTQYLISGFIETQNSREIPTQGQITLTDSTLLNALSHYVALEMTISIPPTMESTTYKMGVYELSLPSETVYWERAEGTFTLRDLTSLLASDVLTDSYTVAAAANPVTSAATLAESSGLVDTQFPAVSVTLPVAMTFNAGETVISVVNKLLEAGNCYACWMNLETNKLVTLPIRDLNTLTPWQSLTPDMLLDVPVTKPVNVNIPNTVIVIKEVSDAAPIVATAINSRADSPTSTVNRQREIALVIKDSNVATATEAAALAQSRLQELSTLEQTVDIVLLPHDPPTTRESLILTYHNAGVCLCGRYWIKTYRYDMLGSTALKVQIGKTQDLLHG